ncbi:hypothetical protein TWF730_003258 [Orbilia blumenaviensis]|uniref:Xylanolytic transcriptional activator regulatory domain-containing protein n=1 Tax=Orbilia blumenaviensis TaxID=1796055 RepID=A0AAV9U4R5_9PEZI
MVSQLGSQVESAVIEEMPNIDTDGAPVAPLLTMDDPIQVETPPVSLNSLSEQTKSSIPQEPGSLIIESNGNLVVGDRFWTIFCGEVERIFEASRGPEPYSFEIHNDPSPESDPQSRSHINYYNFLLRQADAATQYDLVHPHPSQMLLLWQTYVDDIDPFIKIIHVPSITRIIRDLRGQYHSLKPAAEALIFAISTAALSISSEEDIFHHFSVKKQNLFSRYRSYTEKALEKAEILTSNDIEAAQALAIYIYTLRTVDTKDITWALTGLLVRIALRLGLHSDTKGIAGLTVLEQELKRRIWWQICLTDSASNFGISGISQFLISESMFDTPMPSNIDDADINNTTVNTPSTESRRTDLNIFRIRCEIWRLSRRLQYLITAQKGPRQTIPTEDPILFFRNSRSYITESYLRHLRSDIALDCFVNAMIELFFAKIELRLLETRLASLEEVSPIVKSKSGAVDDLFTPALSVLSHTYSLQNEPEWRVWQWHIQDRAPPYHALSIILNIICHRHWESRFEQALVLASNVIATIPAGTPPHQRFAQLLAVAKSRISLLTRTVEPSNQPGPNPLHPDQSLTPDEQEPTQMDDFDFTMFEDFEMPTDCELWVDTVNTFEQWDFMWM